MVEYIETAEITYGCGCVHEIGREDLKIIGSGFWKPTGNNTNCGEHK